MAYHWRSHLSGIDSTQDKNVSRMFDRWWRLGKWNSFHWEAEDLREHVYLKCASVLWELDWDQFDLKVEIDRTRSRLDCDKIATDQSWMGSRRFWLNSVLPLWVNRAVGERTKAFFEPPFKGYCLRFSRADPNTKSLSQSSDWAWALYIVAYRCCVGALSSKSESKNVR